MFHVLWACLLMLGVYMLWEDKHLRPLLSDNRCIEDSKRLETTKQRILCFKTSDSYSKASDAEKNASDATGSGYDKARLRNSQRQEELNRSREVRALLIKQKIRTSKIEFFQWRKRFTKKDYLYLFVFLILPFVILKALQVYGVQMGMEDVLGKVVSYDTDLYLAQLSLTFITISVLSIFTDGNAVIYWQNIVKQTLIEPPACCFKAYFVYSFFYLLMSTVSILLGNAVGVGVFFAFNIICLFDLSRTMISCYYNPNARKRKLVKDFVKRIEKANKAFSDNKREDVDSDTRSINEQLVEDVRSTFEDFNYYTNEAYNNAKYNVVKDNLGVYGKVLAHVNYLVGSADEFPVMEWYDSKTYHAYRDMVQNYYSECGAMMLGHVYSNAAPIGHSVECSIIKKALTVLANDVPNVHEVKGCMDLILYQFYVKVLYVARAADFDNFAQYIIALEKNRTELRLNSRRRELGKKICGLCKWCNEEISMGKASETGYKQIDSDQLELICKQSEFLCALAELIGNIIMINTKDVSVLNLSWIGWEELGDKKEKVLSDARAYVERNSQAFSEERRNQCLSRINEIRM